MWNHRLKSEGERQITEANERPIKRAAFCLFTFSFCLLLIGCRQDMQDQPRYEAYESSKFFKDGLSSRQPVEGTVPRGYLRSDAHLYQGKMSGNQGTGRTQNAATTQTSTQNANASTAANQNQATQQANANTRSTSAGAATQNEADTFPFPITAQVLDRGQERYQIFCAMCHGATGDGLGMIVRRGFKRPPSYHTEELRQATVGHYFDVITKGWGVMPSYAAQIPVQDRWAIIAYIRALQLSRGETADEATTTSTQQQTQQNQQRQQQQTTPRGRNR